MDLTDFRRDGYQIAPATVSRAEVAALLREFDRLKDLASAKEPLDPRLHALWSTAGSGDRMLRGLQNAHFISPLIDALRLHTGVGRILQCALGPDVTTVVTTAFWKPPREVETGIAYHQDAAFRRPESAYRNLAASYVQLAVALDPQDQENGALSFIPGSHKPARVLPRPAQSVLAGNAGEAELRAMGVEPDSARVVRLVPGDAVFWNAFTLHGSAPNRSSDRDRRSFTIGAMRSGDCDQGTPTYVGGAPVPLPRGADST